jgi:hypothetical protein
MRNMARHFVLDAEAEVGATRTTEEIMKNTPRVYLLTVNSPACKALRLWTGRSIHTLRHCSVTQIGSALVEMQKNVDALQKTMRALKQVTVGMEFQTKSRVTS